MPLKTEEEYIESIRKLKPKAFVFGEEVKSVVDHPLLRPAVNTFGLTYKLAQEKEHKDLYTAKSFLTGEKISRFNHICTSSEDLMKKVEMIRLFGQMTGGLGDLRFIGGGCLNALAATTYDMDQKLKTNYYQRLIEFAQYYKQNDLSGAMAMTDVKGDRSLRPHEQVDPEMYVRVVEKRDDGIVVRGAKAHISSTPIVHEIFVMPSRSMSEKDQDYAVAFVIPSDTEGLTHMVTTLFREAGREVDFPLSAQYGTVESLLIFNDVFVPWERVFMCGEYQFASYLVERYASIHRQIRLACSSAYTDILTGAAALAAEYNGLEKVSHIRDKINELVTMSESYHACAIAAAALSIKTPSGVCFANPLYTNVGKIISGRDLHVAYRMVQEIAGGLVQTVPSGRTYEKPELKDYVNRYLKGKADVPTEYRIRVFKLLQDLTTYGFSGFHLTITAVGAGSIYGAKIVVSKQVGLEDRKKIAKAICNIPA